jgi:formylglycine-generating enzyme required for sulfatase activity
MKRKTLELLIAVIVTVLIWGCQNPATDLTKNTSASLSNLTVSTGTLSPEFATAITSYSLSVSNVVTSITVTGTIANAGDTVSANNGVPQTLNVGTNTIIITVTSQDGTTIKNYVVTVYRNSSTPSDYTSANIGTLKGIPAGSFHRDSTANNVSTVSAFRMSQYEITRAQFLAVMGTDPSYTSHSTGLNDPVQNVSWYMAIAFCNKLSLAEGLTPVYEVNGVDFSTLSYSEIPSSNETNWNSATAIWTNNGYRLPSEMEWMWAAMGAIDDRTKAFSGSDGNNSIGDYAVFGYGTSEEGATTLNSSNIVGSKLPNELSVYDLSGNIFEYCWDLSAPYPNGIVTDYHGPVSGTNRICRGGSWIWDASRSTVSYRSSTSMPGAGYVMGLRVVRN